MISARVQSRYFLSIDENFKSDSTPEEWEGFFAEAKQSSLSRRAVRLGFDSVCYFYFGQFAANFYVVDAKRLAQRTAALRHF